MNYEFFCAKLYFNQETVVRLREKICPDFVIC